MRLRIARYRGIQNGKKRGEGGEGTKIIHPGALEQTRILVNGSTTNEKILTEINNTSQSFASLLQKQAQQSHREGGEGR